MFEEKKDIATPVAELDEKPKTQTEDGSLGSDVEKEKEKTEDIEKIKNLSKEIKAIFESFPDKSVLDKYYNASSSLHNQIYAAAKWSEMFSKEKTFKNDPAESNEILANIESIMDQAITKVGEKEENQKGEIFGVFMSANRLKEELEIIAKKEAVL
jgi:hypothetical protein